MWSDPIVEEIHRIRDEHAKKFDYDLHRICEDMRQREVIAGRQTVSHAPRQPITQSINAA